MKKSILLIGVFAPLAAAALLLGGCELVPSVGEGRNVVSGAPASTPATGMTDVSAGETLDPALLKPAANVFHLGPGDQLDIELVGNTETFAIYPPAGVASVTVGPDGKIYYYLLPGIDVWGLTLTEARDRIADGLQRLIRQRPVVSVTLRTVASQQFWILGRVNRAGVYTLARPTTLLDAISQAGGLSSGSALAALAGSLGVSSATANGAAESADLKDAFLIRQGKTLPVDFQRLLRDGDLAQNIYLQPGDFIFLPSQRSPRIHVLGAVVQPRAEPISGSLTLVQAIALANGTEPAAYLSNVAIVRGSVAHPQIGIVDLKAILHGKAMDIRLEAGDIVYVPYTPYRTLERYANLILDTFARTVGVNEGARAVSNNSTGVGVSVSVGP